MYGATRKFVKPFECSVFLHKADLRCDQTFGEILKLHQENPIKQTMQLQYSFFH